MSKNNKKDKDNVSPNQESVASLSDVDAYLEDLDILLKAQQEQDYDEIINRLKDTIDKCQNANIIIMYADALTDYDKKIEYYTKAVLNTHEDALLSEAFFKRGSLKLEYATKFIDFKDAMADLICGGGSQNYGKIDNTIFRKVGILVQGGVGSLDLFGTHTKNCAKWYQLGIDYGDAESYYYLGYYHYDMYQGDKAKGVELFKEGIKRGDKSGKCLLKLGEAYELGLGTEKNIGEAEKLYYQTLNEGHARAYYSLGLMASRANNKTKAHNLYQEGAKRGDGMCMVGLAEEIYHTNLEEAQKLYIKAAETGQVDCLVYGAMTYKDIGNLEMCKKYYLDCYRNGQTVFMVIESDRELVFPGVKFEE